MFRTLTAAAISALALGGAVAETPADTSIGSCAPLELTVYFSPESGLLSDAAEAVIDDAAEQLAGCEIRGAELSVISTDASANPVLPAARRAAVLARLAQAGLRMTITEVQPDGQVVPGFERPIARRVSMTIDATPAITS